MTWKGARTPYQTIENTSQYGDENIHFTLGFPHEAPYSADREFCRYKTAVFTKNGKLIGDFVAVRRLKDNLGGMYDKVTHKFFANAGSGNFTLGTDVPD